MKLHRRACSFPARPERSETNPVRQDVYPLCVTSTQRAIYFHPPSELWEQDCSWLFQCVWFTVRPAETTPLRRAPILSTAVAFISKWRRRRRKMSLPYAPNNKKKLTLRGILLYVLLHGFSRLMLPLQHSWAGLLCPFIHSYFLMVTHQMKSFLRKSVAPRVKIKEFILPFDDLLLRNPHLAIDFVGY